MSPQQYMSMQWTQLCVYLHTTQQQQRQLLTGIIDYDMLPNLVKYDTTIHTTFNITCICVCVCVYIYSHDSTFNHNVYHIDKVKQVEGNI